MGLGKTIQVIGFLCALWERFHIRGPHLVVMPLSVLSSWEGDIQTFCGDAFDVYVHQGEKNARYDGFKVWKKRLIEVEAFLANDSHAINGRSNNSAFENLKLESQKISIVLTTYDMIIKDFYLFQQFNGGAINWQYLVVIYNTRIAFFIMKFSLK